jgi:Methylase involved in ubiquinone/menaquinone biosynthesis
MWRDVVDIRDFYATPLGQTARRMIRRRLRHQWSDVTGQTVLGLGYPIPYLGTFRNEATQTIAAMPAQQGVLHWPHEDPGLTTLVDELELPFDDLSFDRVLLVHALEYAEQVRPLLREIWRILAGSGRLIVIVPNRRGLWARFERTPFGHGLPYSARQLSLTLRENLFTPLDIDRALFAPPLRSTMIRSISAPLEQIGNRAFNTFGGVIIAESVKQIYAAPPVKERSRIRRYLPLPEHQARPTSPN